MSVKMKSWRLLTLLVAVSLLLTAFIPAAIAAPAPPQGVRVPERVTEGDLVREPVLAGAAAAEPVREPLALGADKRIPVGVRPEVAALAAAGAQPVRVSVQLNKPSLSAVGREMTPEQRVAYAAEVAALQDQVIAQVEAEGGKVLGRFRTLSSGFVAEMAGVSASKLAARPDVVRVSLVRDYQLDLHETVPWIGAGQLQELGITGEGVKVAVLDTGIDFTHKAFGGPGTTEAWEMAYFGDNPACATGREPQCANAKLPDPAFFGPDAPKVKGGWDFIGDAWVSGSPEVQDPNPIDSDYTPPRTGGHGTHVADIIGGLAYPGQGAGVAPDADLWAFKVCSSLSTACSGVGLLNGVDAAADLDRNPATIDPADVINMSLGAPYGQPEDDLTFFTNQAVAYGIIVVASAGNSSDKPYIAGSPSIADGAISVAQTQVPSAKQFLLSIEAPESLKGVLKTATFQPWSVPLETAGPVSGMVAYGNADGSNKNGCAAFTDSLAGKVALIDRGACNFTLKAKNAGAAGAVLALIGLVAPGDPFEGGDGGDRPIAIPTFMISQAESNKIKSGLSQGVIVAADPDNFIGLADSIVGSSSRGPRNNDSMIKPDIGAPGASISAIAGAGEGTGPFGGTSGAAPMVSGSAALLKGFFGDQLIPQQYKALLMNTANTQIYLDGAVENGGGGTLAPITRIGGGQVDVAKAYMTRILAWDSTDRANPLAWTGSLSFGYEPVSDTYVATRILTIKNLHPLGQSVWFSSSFRYASDEGKGVTVEPVYEGAFIPSGMAFDLPVRLTVDARGLRDWYPSGPNKGSQGANGPLFTTYEYDGYITIETCNGGGTTCTGESVTVPWHVLPKKAAEAAVADGDSSSVTLENAAPVAASNTDVFALVDQSDNLYDYTVGDCMGLGMGPGCNETAIDLKEVGVRDWTYDGASYVEFGITVWDKPYRSSQFPPEFDVYVDANRDGNADYVVYNGDLAGGSDGRNATFVYSFATGRSTAYYYTDSGFNTQNWILTVPAAAIGLAPGQQFDFQVWAFDAYFTGLAWDCSPFDDGWCEAMHTFTVGKPRFDVGEANLFPIIDAGAEVILPFTTSDEAEIASPSQVGFLFLHREAPVGRESSVFIPPAGPEYDTPVTETFPAAGDTYIHNGLRTTNFGTSPFLHIGGNDTSRSVAQFDVSSIATDYPVDKAVLSVYIDAYSGGGSAADLQAFELTTPWTELGATWLAPWAMPGGDFGGMAVASVPVVKADVGSWKRLDITPLVQKWVADPAGNHGVVLRLLNQTSFTNYRLTSRDYWYPQYGPQLEVSYRKP